MFDKFCRMYHLDPDCPRSWDLFRSMIEEAIVEEEIRYLSEDLDPVLDLTDPPPESKDIAELVLLFMLIILFTLMLIGC